MIVTDQDLCNQTMNGGKLGEGGKKCESCRPVQVIEDNTGGPLSYLYFCYDRESRLRYATKINQVALFEKSRKKQMWPQEFNCSNGASIETSSRKKLSQKASKTVDGLRQKLEELEGLDEMN